MNPLYKHKSYYYDSQTDDRRARLTDINMPLAHRTRLVIRSDRGQGELLLNKTYTTHKGARRALSRLGSDWKLYKKTTW